MRFTGYDDNEETDESEELPPIDERNPGYE
jgi:hypothetical protein